MTKYPEAKRVVKFEFTYIGLKDEEYVVDGIVKDGDEYLENLIKSHIEMQNNTIRDLKIHRKIITDYGD